MHFVCMQEAVRNVEYWRLSDKDGKPPGLMGWWPGRAVTFLDNHDTGVLVLPLRTKFPGGSPLGVAFLSPSNRLSHLFVLPPTYLSRCSGNVKYLAVRQPECRC